jgi:hypothetical protein
MPITCGTIDKALTREVLLEPVNNSGIAGTARVALAGSRLYAWLSLGGETEGQMHVQHIHFPKGNGRGAARPRISTATATASSACRKDSPPTAHPPCRWSRSRRPRA